MSVKAIMNDIEICTCWNWDNLLEQRKRKRIKKDSLLPLQIFMKFY